jgi:phenylacetate-CoA ligase
MYGWWGIQPWDNLARCTRWGLTRRSEVVNSISWWPTRQAYLDASLITPASMHAFHAQLQRTKPALIEGYVGAVLEFAEFLEANGLRIPQLRAVATTSAPLVPTTRARLEAIYQVPVYDEYRGTEINWIAGECTQRNGLHIFSDMRRVEVVDTHGRPLPAGEVGDIVITDLTNRVFPLIRYRNGDRGSLLDGECACGRTLPRMAQPAGRIADVLRLPDGSAMNDQLMELFSDQPDAVRLFQIHQHADYSIVVRVVAGDVPDAPVQIEHAVDVLRRRIARAVPVDVEFVDSLPYTGGKTKYIISDVPHGV